MVGKTKIQQSGPALSQLTSLKCNAWTLIIIANVTAEAQFKRRTFHVPNLIPLIKYMKRSTFESIKFNMCNLGRPKN